MSSLLSRTSSRRVPRLMASTGSHYRVRSTCPPGTRIATVRQPAGVERRWFHEARRLFAQKDAQDKDSLRPRSTEYSTSGGGDDAAATAGAFDGSTSSPEKGSKKVALESGEGDPMKASPGNPNMSRQKPQEDNAAAKTPSAAGEASNRERTSSKQSPKKHGGSTSG